MPSGTSIRDFIRDLQTRKSSIANKLDACSADQGRRAAIRGHIDAWDPAAPLPAAIVEALGLNAREVDHMNRWDVAQKGSVRDAALTAIDQARDMEFFWELYDGAASDTTVDDPGAPAKITVIFHSPRTNVRIASPGAWGEIKVDVGP